MKFVMGLLRYIKLYLIIFTFFKRLMFSNCNFHSVIELKDLEQLRHHMQWIHKVKIHPKMIHNRPPLNCQKCQCRFFTDQGLERHLLGSHGLVTSSMQEAANRGQDGGRCPICGKVFTLLI